jgi:branched-chain amino acid transport system permease protein
VPILNLFVIGVALLCMLTLQIFISRTKMGRAMRTTAMDRDASSLMGVDINRTIMITFLIGSALAGAAGVIHGLYYGNTSFTLGFQSGLKAFTAAVFGGIGNLGGAVVGGLLLGLIESIGSGYLGELTGGVLGSHYADIFAFVALILVLTLRPSGLLGERVADRA